MKYEYYIKQVSPTDFKNFLRLAGNTGWKLIQVIILQRMKPSLVVNQMPQMEILYEAIMIREQNSESIEDIESDQESEETEKLPKRN
jgi:hypothetical protein